RQAKRSCLRTKSSQRHWTSSRCFILVEPFAASRVEITPRSRGSPLTPLPARPGLVSLDNADAVIDGCYPPEALGNGFPPCGEYLAKAASSGRAAAGTGTVRVNRISLASTRRP